MRRARGRHLESLVLASQGTVTLTKIPNGVRYLPGGKTIPCKSPVDFAGTVHGSGRAVWLDAKQCDLKGRFPVGNKDHVTPQQIAELVRHGRAGAVAGLLVERTGEDELYWCDWSILTNAPPSYAWKDLAYVGSSKLAVNWWHVLEAAQ